MKFFISVAVWVLLSAVSVQRASAASCSASVTTPISFTGVDPFGAATYDTTATLSVTCSGYILNPLIGLCFNIGSGTGGTNPSNERLAVGPGGQTLRFQFFQDAARLIPWGSLSNGVLGGVPLLSLTGNGSANIPIYLRLYTTGGSTTPGTYTSQFAGADATLQYGTILSVLLGCGGLGSLLTSTTTAPFTVQASLQPSCLLNVTQNVNFGTAAAIGANIDSAGSLNVQCSAGTTYRVAISAGNGAGATTAQRRMTGPGATTVSYGLYRDPARSQTWGDSIDIDTMSGTGNGGAGVLSVYGRVPPQINPGAGLFSDTVIVTLSY